ncbi:MAG TPA: putative glycoside hydrolase [Bacilli bacterium]
MEMLIAALLMIWGSLTAGHTDITFEQLVQASLDLQKGTVEVPGTLPGTDAGLGLVKQDPQTDAPVVKGLYSTGNTAGGARLASLLKLIDETELNALVIDIKDDWGNITYKTDHPELAALGNSKKFIGDITKLMLTLQEHQVYPIARVVVFKDTYLANKKPELSFLNANGTVWTNGKKESFVNPYKKEVWDYNIQVAKEAAKLGFKEIQFDYVRFPEGFEKRADILKYDKDKRTRVQVVTEFVKYAREQLNPLGVRVSVDIFGFAASVPAAEGIGQDFEGISRYVDVICPMVYPSHYSTGWFGSKVPDAAPYVTIAGAMEDTHTKLLPLGGLKPVIRPWIQDFTAPWISGYIRYGKNEVEQQIKALKDNGVNEYLLWNSGNVYSAGVDYK